MPISTPDPPAATNYSADFRSGLAKPEIAPSLGGEQGIPSLRHHPLAQCQPNFTQDAG
jgi:hypothetical protein